MSTIEANLALGKTLADHLAEEGVPAHLRVSPFAVAHLATYILEQQPGLVRPSLIASDKKILLADSLQSRFNEVYGIDASFEQTGRLIEKAAQAAHFVLEGEGYHEPLVLPAAFQEFHPLHLERIAGYCAVSTS